MSSSSITKRPASFSCSVRSIATVSSVPERETGRGLIVYSLSSFAQSQRPGPTALLTPDPSPHYIATSADGEHPSPLLLPTATLPPTPAPAPKSRSKAASAKSQRKINHSIIVRSSRPAIAQDAQRTDLVYVPRRSAGGRRSTAASPNCVTSSRRRVATAAARTTVRANSSWRSSFGTSLFLIRRSHA